MSLFSDPSTAVIMTLLISLTLVQVFLEVDEYVKRKRADEEAKQWLKRL